VPHFIIGGEYHISGVQPLETFVSVLAEAEKLSHGPMDQKLR
jgi:predicted DsbA family dithiol-disulfide isomerase